MFKLDDSHSYLWPVKVQTPVDGGRFREDRFDARFRVLDQDRLDQILDLRGGGGAERADVALLEEVWVGWGERAIGDAAGEPLEFSAENRAKLLKIPYLRLAVARAYFDSVTGRAFAAKN